MTNVFALRWRPSERPGRVRSEAVAETFIATGEWRQLIKRRGFLLLMCADPRDVAPLILPEETGLVLGPVFSRLTMAPITAIAADDVEIWGKSDSAAFVDQHWGAYLAIFCDRARDRVLIVRDPSGARPCWIADADEYGVRMLFTRAQDYLPHGRAEIDDVWLRAFLSFPRLVSENTGLAQVKEVLAGECLSLGRDGSDSRQVWRPPPSQSLGRPNFDGRARELRDVVRACAKTWTGLGLPITHRLSGGLDSSIVLSALVAAAAEGQVHCITEYPADCPEGDERSAARAVAQRFDVALREVEYRAAEIDYARVLTVPANVNPSLSDLSFADERFVTAEGTSESARLLTSGQGGDQIFHKADPAPGIADAVRDRVGLRLVLAAALDAAHASRRSIYPGLATGITYGLLRSPRAFLERTLRKRLGASETAMSAAAEVLGHPWLSADRIARAGDALRALLFADLQYYHANSVLDGHFTLAPVLASLPIVEFCYETPLYMMSQGGHDRALARAAFAADLPASSVARLRKGDTTRFFAAVQRRNHAFMREVLLDGELAKRRVIERATLEAALSGRRDVEDGAINVSAYLAAELWLQRLRASSAAKPACVEPT